MQCVMCKHGQTSNGKTVVTLRRSDTMVVIKDVPAEVCQQCGEYYLDDKTTGQVLSMAEDAVKHNVEVEILRYAA